MALISGFSKFLVFPEVILQNESGVLYDLIIVSNKQDTNCLVH